MLSTILSRLLYSNLFTNSIIGEGESSTVRETVRFPHLSNFNQVGSVRRMLMFSEGMSAPFTTYHWTLSMLPVLMAMWSKALPLTASCLSPLQGFESRLGHERILPVT